MDDLLLHGPTTLCKVEQGLDFVLAESQRLVRLVYQPVKLLPPKPSMPPTHQCLKACGFLYYDTNGMLTLHIPEDKVSKALTLIEFL